MRRYAGLTLARVDSKLLWAAGVALAAGLALGTLNGSNLLLVFLVAGAALLVVSRRDEITAAMVIVAAVLLDWYQMFGAPLQLASIGLFLALALAGVLFFTQSAERPWVSVPRQWLWLLLLALGLYPALHGSSLTQGVMYYITIFVASPLLYLLGVQVARDLANVRRLLSWLAGFGACVGLHSVLVSETGTFLLATPHINEYLALNNYFRVIGSHTPRAGSFLLNPDWNGAFLAMLLFIPAGLLLTSRSRWMKLFYLGEVLLMLAGLYVTYSLSSLIAVGVGLITFVVLVARARRIILSVLGLLGVIGVAVCFVFRTQFNLLMSHASTEGELSLRLGGWETALQVMRAHPFGIGLGLQTYTDMEAFYRVPLQTSPLAHPHNAFLELGALAGIPALVVFLILLASVCWLALRAYCQTQKRDRMLLGCVLVSMVVLSVNSLGINAWTLPPLVALAWLMLGAVTSPALRRALQQAAPGRADAVSIARAREQRALSVGGGL